MSEGIPADRLGAIRDVLPALRHAVYGNTGSAGPLPRPAASALDAAFARQLDEGRIGPHTWTEAGEVASGVRGGVARLLSSAQDRVALTHHTTDGINIAALGIRWRPGDVALTTDLEHLANQIVVGALRLRHGVEVRVVRLSQARSLDEVAGMLESAMQGAVRAVFLSHVSYATGAILPLPTVAEMAHIWGAAVVVDGAQSVGAMPVSPAELGADFYTVSGQKWLCGPEGTGALWVAPGWEERLLPGVVGYAGMARVDAEGYSLPAAGARRFEVGTTFSPALAGLRASLDWMEGIGWPAIWGRTQDLAERARLALAEVPGVDVLTPEVHAGLVSFRLGAVAAEAAVAALRERGFLVRSIPGWNAVRISCGFFLEEAEIDSFAEAVAAVGRS